LNIVLYVIYLAAIVYAWLIIARALLSWLPVRQGNVVHRIQGTLVRLTEPYLRLFRRLLPSARIGAVGIDLSSIVGLIALFVVVQVVVRL